MKTKTITNIAASIKARLLNAARERGCTFNTLLSRYSNERFLYRLGKSPYRGNLILKGSNLFLIWQQGYPYRPTIDSDFLVMGRTDQDYLKSVFMDICSMQVDKQDGLDFLSDSVEAAEIREESQYGGTRITLTGYLGTAKAHLQFDLGIGDVVTPSQNGRNTLLCSISPRQFSAHTPRRRLLPRRPRPWSLLAWSTAG